VLVRQTGSNKIAGPGTFISRDFTIHAAIDGIVGFKKVKKGHFTGKSVPRTQVSVS
jgi:large subunit ribosomal protein L27